MDATVDYYALLGLPSGAAASEGEIRAAYRKRILQVHVDKLGVAEDTDLCYRTIEAWRVLSNRATRAQYDVLRDTLLNRQPTDTELRHKYGQDGEGSELRARWAAERKSARNLNRTETLPAICYDVGEAQLSRSVAARLAAWESEFAHLRLDDNFFESLSSVFSKALQQQRQQQTESVKAWKCRLCDANFINEGAHWNSVLAPYVKFLSLETPPARVEGALDTFFHSHVGELYAFKPRYLPPRPSGIWGDSRLWAKFPRLHRRVGGALDALRADVGDLRKNYKFIPRTRGLTAAESDIVVWGLRNQASGEKLRAKASALLAVNQIEPLLALSLVMQRVERLNLSELVAVALEGVQLELAMFWTMLGNLLGLPTGAEGAVPDWWSLGMRIHEEADPTLAHFCFLIGGYEMEDVATAFAAKGDHYAAAEWLLNCSRPETMLQRPAVHPRGSGLPPDFYTVVFNCSEVKKLLKRLESGPEPGDLDRLVEFMSKLFPDSTIRLLEGLRTLVTVYPREAIASHALHRTVIRLLKRTRPSGRQFDENLRNIVGAFHFLPPEEFDSTFVQLESRRMIRGRLEAAVRACDYEGLTDALLRLEKRNLPAAESLLQDYGNTEAGGSVLNEAMRFLVQGAIEGVKCNWLQAMSAYQSALLSTPECMYRLVPCVSRLTQDELFHESVLSRVHAEVRSLKEFFDFREYVEIDGAVDSLVVSDPVPSQEFGYEERTGRLQPVEPPPAKPPADDADAAQPPPAAANTPLVTLTKNERAIEQSVDAGAEALAAAFGYLDLIKALPPHNQNGPLVMAASHLLRAMDAALEEPSKLFAYRNCILMLAQQLLGLESGAAAGVQACLSHKHMFSIMLMANQKLSKALAEQEPQNSDSESDGSEIEENSKGPSLRRSKSKSQLLTTPDSNLISDYLENIVRFPRIEPLVNIPTLNCSDLQYVETVWSQFMLQFCRDKVRTADSSTGKASGGPSSYLQAFTLFNEVRAGRSDLFDFDTARVKAIEMFLTDTKLQQSEKWMQWPLGRFTPEGWTDVLAVGPLHFEAEPEMQFRAVDGFQIDHERCAISFFVRRPLPADEHALICDRDLVEIFENGVNKLNLEFCDPRGHPCQEIRVSPSLECASVPEFQRTALRVANLIHFFAAGVELNTTAPFYIRNATLGLMSRLPEHLQYFCRSLRLRGRKMDAPGFKFWLRFTEVYYEDELVDAIYTYKVGNVNAELVPAEDGATDAISSFAADFTRSYDEISIYYPELARLKELYKISLIYRRLRAILAENAALIAQNGRSEEEIFRLGQLCFSIRKLGISEAEEDVECAESRSVWIPAVGCHNLWRDTDDATGGGVQLDVEPIFGPVCDSGAAAELVPALRFFLSPDKVETELDVTLEIKSNCKAHQFANLVKEAVAADANWWQSEGGGGSSHSGSGTATPVTCETDPSACAWKLLQGNEELHYNGMLIYKRVPPKQETEMDTSSSSSSSLPEFERRQRLDSESSSDFSSDGDNYEEDELQVNSQIEKVHVNSDQGDFEVKFTAKYRKTPVPSEGLSQTPSLDAQEPQSPANGHEPLGNGSENEFQQSFLAEFSQKYFSAKGNPPTQQMQNPVPLLNSKSKAKAACYSLRDMEASFWRVYHVIVDKTKDCYACYEDESGSESEESDSSSSSSRKQRKARKRSRGSPKKFYKLFYNGEDAENESQSESEVSSPSSSSSSQSESSSSSSSSRSSQSLGEECLIRSGVYRIGKAYTDPLHGPLTMELHLLHSSGGPSEEQEPDDALNPKFSTFFIHGMNSNHLTRSNSMYIPRSRSGSSSRGLGLKLNRSGTFSEWKNLLERSNSTKSTTSCFGGPLSRSASASYSAAFVFASVGEEGDEEGGRPEQVSVILPSNIRKRIAASTEKAMYVE